LAFERSSQTTRTSGFISIDKWKKKSRLPFPLKNIERKNQ
jgi:hypothetical protein